MRCVCGHPVCEGQTDRASFAGIGPVARTVGMTDAQDQIAALLHDTVELCGVTRDDVMLKFGNDIFRTVDAVTCRKGDIELPFFAQVKPDHVAPTAKLPDIADNAHPQRFCMRHAGPAQRLPVKYAAAQAFCGG